MIDLKVWPEGSSDYWELELRSSGEGHFDERSIGTDLPATGAVCIGVTCVRNS